MCVKLFPNNLLFHSSPFDYTIIQTAVKISLIVLENYPLIDYFYNLKKLRIKPKLT